MNIVLLMSAPAVPLVPQHLAKTFLTPDSEVAIEGVGTLKDARLVGLGIRIIGIRRTLTAFLARRKRIANAETMIQHPIKPTSQSLFEILHSQVKSAATLWTTGFRSERFLAQLRSLQPDLCIYLGGTDILYSSLLSIPRLGVLGAHYALLPKLRGMNVTEWAVLLNEPVGVAVQVIGNGIDTGPVVLQRSIDVTPGDTLLDLRMKSSRLAKQLLLEALCLAASGKFEPKPQDPEAGKQYFRMHQQLRVYAEARLQNRSSE